MLKFSEIFEFSKEKFRKIPILKEFDWFEWFEWFGPSPIEPESTKVLAGSTISLAMIPEAIAFAFVAGVSPIVGLQLCLFEPKLERIFRTSNLVSNLFLTSV